MYIEKYCENYIGGTDDSLTFFEYLENRNNKEIAVSDIFSETGLDKLSSFRNTDYPLCVMIDGFEAEIHYAITLIMDLAALMLECKINGSVNIGELLDDDIDCIISIRLQKKNTN